MNSNPTENKKLSIVRIMQILQKETDEEHHMKQDEIVKQLYEDYELVIERKAVGRSIALLKEAGLAIKNDKNGFWLVRSDSDMVGFNFDDSELKMLIDGVLCSKYVPEKYSSDLINKLCRLSNKYFVSHVKNIFSVSERNKSENLSLFHNIELIDEAIEKKKQIVFNFNKYGIDKKMFVSSTITVSPYQLMLNNQRYYLMALNEHYKHISYFRVDHITNMEITDIPLTPLRSVPGYERGIDYKEMISSLPYMFSDKPESIVFLADDKIVDQIIEWFGKGIRIEKTSKEGIVRVMLKASPKAMEYWAMQYLNSVEIQNPVSLRDRIRENITAAAEKYNS